MPLEPGQLVRFHADRDGSGQVMVVRSVAGDLVDCTWIVPKDGPRHFEFRAYELFRVFGWYVERINNPQGDNLTLWEHRDLPGDDEYCQLHTTWTQFRLWQSLDNNRPAVEPAAPFPAHDAVKSPWNSLNQENHK